ncbi:MAG: uroporphyrinogen-III synthase [Acidiferrobacteraceae bacterium]|nr:uroporphyrinogen-III synthase [Acidiferrobacteraceae bacterium]
MPDLDGVSVVVTRAPHQSRELCDLIEVAGGEAVCFPVTKIEPLPDNDTAVIEGLKKLSQADMTIFVSPNAVSFGFDLLQRRGLALSAHTQVFAIGPGTARQLASRGAGVDGVPQGRYDSEALLALPALQNIRGLSVLIIRGLAGRETLAQTLAQRGATVSHLPCYRRTRPDRVDVKVMERWRDTGFDVVVLTSASAANHLWSILAGNADTLLGETALVVSSERISTHCRSLGFTGTIEVADNASMPALVEAASRWRAGRPHGESD